MIRRRTHSAEYHAHLASPEWARMRKAALEAAGYSCALCGRDRRQLRLMGRHLQVHHKHYRNLGHERLEDLTVLCGGGTGACHPLADVQRRAATKPRRSKRSRSHRRGLGLRTALLAWGGLFVIIGLAGDLLPK